MKGFVRPAAVVLTLLLCLGAAASLAGPGGLERTLFKDLPPADPAREIVRTILDSPFYSMRAGFTAKAWAAEGFRDAWERARSYFPGKTYFVVPGTHFMTHGFDPDGKLFMEVHESAYLTLCVENRRTFTAGAIVGEYGRMRGQADLREAASFHEKVGRLEPFFLDAPGNGALRKTLGETVYAGFIGKLREENYPMLAGGLMHEGIHAALDDAVVARLRADFEAGRMPVQWDELRAFMAEIAYHGRYCEWAANDHGEVWDRIGAALAKLESFRKRPKLRPGVDRARFEKLRAGAFVEAALARLRMREIWQSARRIGGLLASFRADYVRDRPPVEVEGPLAVLESDAGRFIGNAGEAIQAGELALRDLEGTLDEWSDWAEGRRPFPPPVTDSKAVMGRAAALAWPDPPADGPRALMKLAGAALEKVRALS